jgi:hypothetical protein
MKKKAPTKPKRVDDIVVDLEPILMPLHGGVVALGLPREAWPTPSPQELASIVGACGWQEKADGPQRAMRLAWQCAQVIHESHSSTDAFIKDKARRKSRKAKQLEEVTGRDITALPDEITHSTLVSCFNTERLKINGKDLRGIKLLDAWLMSIGQTPATWHALRSPKVRVSDHSIPGERWGVLAVQIARFNEWRKTTGNENKGHGRKNLRRGTQNSQEVKEGKKYLENRGFSINGGRKIKNHEKFS